MKIIDAFTFYNEIELLKLRLATLKDAVDYFVISEMGITHSGVAKGFPLQHHLNSLPVPRERIVHVALTDWPAADVRHEQSRWVLENFQRNEINRGLHSLQLQPHDIVLISDLDEIPDPFAIKQAVLQLQDYEAAVFCQVHRKFFINAIAKEYVPNQYWLGTVAARAGTVEDLGPQALRRQGPFPHGGFIWTKGRAANTCYIEPGGWHLTYFGGPETVGIKQQSIVEGWKAHEATRFSVPAPSLHNWSFGRSPDIVAWRNSLPVCVLPAHPGSCPLAYLPAPVLKESLAWEWLWWYDSTIDEWFKQAHPHTRGTWQMGGPVT
jgi:hypothetical protein